MAKDKIQEAKYKIEGLHRMIKRKVKRGRKNRKKSIDKINQQHFDRDYIDPWNY